MSHQISNGQFMIFYKAYDDLILLDLKFKLKIVFTTCLSDFQIMHPFNIFGDLEVYCGKNL